MSTPAQRPPSDASYLELIAQACTELLFLGLSGLAGICVSALLIWTGVLPEDATWSGIVGGPVLIGTSAVVYLLIEQRSASDGEPAGPLVWERDRKSVSWSVVIALGGIAAAVVGSAALALVQELLFAVPIEEQPVFVEIAERGDVLELSLLAISALVLAPVTEELLFRHMLFRRMMHRVGPIAAWVLPALAFALTHDNSTGLVIYVWLGLVFAYCYLLTGRLWVAMAVHAGSNAFALANLLYLAQG